MFSVTLFYTRSELPMLEKSRRSELDRFLLSKKWRNETQHFMLHWTTPAKNVNFKGTISQEKCVELRIWDNVLVPSASFKLSPRKEL
jgi:hypothetical protein